MNDQIGIGSIRVADRLRTLDPDYVAFLAASISEIGLQTPIIVAEAEDSGAKVYRLVGGFHRLEACKHLGWTAIQARVMRGNDLDRRLVEIDENLCRNDLSIIDKARHVAERRRIIEQLYPRNHGGDRRRKQVDIMSTWSVTQDVAEKMGLSPRHMRRLFSLDFALAPDVRERLAPTLWRNRFSELKRLSGHQPDMQRRIVAELLHPDDPAKSVAAAERRIHKLPSVDASRPETLVRRLFGIWGRLGRAEKIDVLARLIETGELDDLADEARIRAGRAAQPLLKLVATTRDQ